MRSQPSPDWRQRAVVWPSVAIGAPLLTIASPLLFVAALLIDLITGPRRLRMVRLLGMALNYAALVVLGLIAGALLWLGTGAGLLMHTRWSQRAHHRVQIWWTGAVFTALRRWLGARVTVDGADLAARGPIVVLARHASFFDAVLPSVVIGHTVALRHVLKRELTWEPCLDLFGHRLPNVFVQRGSSRTREQLDQIRALATDLHGHAVVIFPEGTFPSAAAAARVLAGFNDEEPERAGRLHLTHSLPPRPGGALALLDGAPSADLVVMAHVGFEPFGSLRAIVRNVPFREEVKVKLWRIPRGEIPEDPTAQLALIDEWWQRLDDWIDHHATTGGSNP